MNPFLRQNLPRAGALVFVSLTISAAIAIAINALLPTAEEPDELDELAARIGAIVYPRTDLSPADVVQIQLDACAGRDWGRGSLQCFCFASPSNRAVTGPLARFGQMLRQPPYDVLNNPDRVLIGRPKLVQGTSRILVTVAKDEKIYVFVWLLEKQTDAPFDGCWMTEAVLAVEPPRNRLQHNPRNLPTKPHPLTSGDRIL